MRKEELVSIIDSLLPRVYGLAFALMGDELEAEQVIIDAYTVYLMQDKDFLLKESFDSSDSKERSSIRRYLLKELFREVFELCQKRIPQLSGKNRKNLLEFESFYRIGVNKRAVMYLKEIEKFQIEDLQEIFSMERHRVLELFHNAKHELLIDKKINNEEMLSWN
ncbi:MAG: hypothetical protein HON90_09420 [Halobacteriovoraceae bacterium]|jgi:hypothetical protein|nr:hypothetical protein [Halobacteriovoraceae bacterium]